MSILEKRLQFGEKVVLLKPWYSRLYRPIVEGRLWDAQLWDSSPVAVAKLVYRRLITLDKFHYVTHNERLFSEEIFDLAEYIGMVYDDYAPVAEWETQQPLG